MPKYLEFVSRFIPSKLIHFLGLTSHLDLITFVLLFLLLLFLNSTSGYWYIASFYHFVKLFIKLLDSTRQKENVVISFFDEQVSCLATLSLVLHVYNDQLICLILKSVQLWNDFISCYIGSWIVYAFLDSPEIIFVWFSQIEK